MVFEKNRRVKQNKKYEIWEIRYECETWVETEGEMMEDIRMNEAAKKDIQYCKGIRSFRTRF